jgi:hypothetical protein
MLHYSLLMFFCAFLRRTASSYVCRQGAIGARKSSAEICCNEALIPLKALDLMLSLPLPAPWRCPVIFVIILSVFYAVEPNACLRRSALLAFVALVQKQCSCQIACGGEMTLCSKSVYATGFLCSSRSLENGRRRQIGLARTLR